MTVTTVKTALQTLHAGITGVTSAPTAWPEAALSSANFPQVLVKKGPGKSQKVAGKTWGRDSWEVYVFLAQQHQNTYAQANTDADTFIERFRAKYTDPANFTLSYSPSIVQIESFDPEGLEDTGLVEIEYLGKIYYGFIFRVQILEKEI